MKGITVRKTDKGKTIMLFYRDLVCKGCRAEVGSGVAICPKEAELKCQKCGYLLYGPSKKKKKAEDVRMIVVDCCFDCPHIDFGGDMGTHAFCEVTRTPEQYGRPIPNKYRIPSWCKLKKLP